VPLSEAAADAATAATREAVMTSFGMIHKLKETKPTSDGVNKTDTGTGGGSNPGPIGG
jgi:hypothetical protein